jgi:spore photoproduct lyase
MSRQGETRRATPCLPFAQQPSAYISRPVPFFCPDKIVLTKGCQRGAHSALVGSMLRAYPGAEVVDQTDRSHAQVDLGVNDPLARHRTGKQTLVIGEHNSAVRFSDESDNCCPNYWHFCPYGFCPYGCAYCYLAGTRGVWFSPTVRVFLNLDEMLSRIDRIASDAGKPTSFYLGKLQDGLAMDPLAGYFRRLVPFFAQHRWARLVVLTKSADVANLLDLCPAGNVILSWSLSTDSAWRHFEPGTPSPAERLNAMKRCAIAGYRVRAVIMPILPVGRWEEEYEGLLDELFSAVPVERLTLGSLCSYPNALRLTSAKLGTTNPIHGLLRAGGRCQDGRYRFAPRSRLDCYRRLLDFIRARRPELRTGLCLEDRSVFKSLGLSDAVGICNCVL